MPRLPLILMLLTCCFCGAAQQSNDNWTLQRCVQYAREHNISIQQNELNVRLSRLTLQQSQLAQLPSANASAGYGRSYGRSVDPTTNQFVNGNYDFLSLGASSDVLIFGWFQRRRTIQRNELNARAADADLDQLKDDVSLNIATGFLRALLADEQIKVNQQQVALSQAQYGQTVKFAEAGRVPELNVAQLQAQLSSDSSRLITAIADYNAALLDLRALLNLDFEIPFSIAAPETDQQQTVAELASQTPESIYTVARQHFGAIKSSELKLEAARKNVAATSGARFPTLGFNAQVGTNYATTFQDYSNPTITGSHETGNYVDVNGTPYPIYQPTYAFTTATTPLGHQVNNNLRQTYTFNLNIPLFSSWQSEGAYRQARIQVENDQLARYQSELKLRQDVYKAYNDAKASAQKFAAAQRAYESAQRAYGFGEKRYQLGLTNTVEYLTIQNNQYAAAANLAGARYDLIFRLKVIDYYLGKELKL